MMPLLYRVKDWDEHFENNRTRELKHMDWVPIPNRFDGDGYTELVDHPDGAAHFGAWCAIVEVASKCDPRGTLLRAGGTPHDASSLSRITRLPASVFDAVLPRLTTIGWLTSEVVVSSIVEDASHEGAGIPQEGAVKSHRSDYGTEGNGREGNTPPTPASGGADAAETRDALPGFDRFWSEWPTHRRKADKARCRRKWERSELELIAEQVIEGLRRWKASTDWIKQGGQFVPAPLVWLNAERWKVPASAFAEQASAQPGNGAFARTFTPEMAAAAGVPYSPEGENGGGE